MIRSSEAPRLGTVYNTSVPLIGSVDTSNPLEWLFAAAIVASVFIPRKIENKALFAGGVIAARWQLSKVSL